MVHLEDTVALLGQASDPQQVVEVFAGIEPDLQADPGLLLCVVRTLLRLNALDPAEHYLQVLLTLVPDHPEGLRLLAIVHFDRGRYQEAVNSFEILHEKHGVDKSLIEQFAYALCISERTADAGAFLDWALTVWPDEMPIIRAKAHQCFRQSRHLEGILVASRLPLEFIQNQDTGFYYVAALSQLGNCELALRVLDQIVPQDCRDQSSVYAGLQAAIASLSSDYHGAERWLRRAMAIEALHPDHEFNYFSVLAMLGHYSRAWEHFSRRDAGLKRGRVDGIPEWTGQPLQGATVLVHAEQGIGDNIQFMRYLPELEKRGAKVIYSTYPALMELFSSISPARVSVAESQVLSATYQSSTMDLPGYLGLPTLGADSQGGYYLVCPEAKRNYWKEQLASAGRCRIGLVWAGSPDFANDHNRSAALADFLSLAAVPGIDWYSVQLGGAAIEVKSADFPCRINDLSETIVDLADTAGILENLDLVISVDTSVAHLAGALGRPVWLLHSRLGDWRWGLEGETTLWYPTMRVFRQTKDWASLLRNEVRRALAAFVEKRIVPNGGHTEGLSWIRGLPIQAQMLPAWRRSLETNQDFADALLLARALALDFGRVEALEYLVEQLPDSTVRDAKSYIAEYLASKGEFQRAVNCWEKLSGDVHPLPASSFLAWARAYGSLGKSDKARDCLVVALAAHPDSSALNTEYALCLYDMGARLEDVAALLKRVIEAQSRNVTALWLAGSIALEHARHDEATRDFQAALRLAFGSDYWWAQFALAAARMGYAGFSAQQLQLDNLLSRPTATRVEQLPAVVSAGRYDLAECVLTSLLTLDINQLLPNQLSGLAYAAATTRCCEAHFFGALKHWLDLRSLPLKTDAERNISLTLAGYLLRTGQARNSWMYFLGGLRTFADFGVPHLSSAEVKSKKILVVQDQGFGDCIQYLPAVLSLARENEVTFAVIEPLFELLSKQEFPFGVVPIGSVTTANEFADYQCRLMALVALTELDLDSPLVAPSYIVPVGSHPRIESLARQYDGSLKVGLVWAGNQRHVNDALRSSRLQDWEDLFAVRGATIFSLQKDEPSQQMIAYPEGVNLAELFDDFAEAASAIAAMDVIVGVDTGLLHLSAAMGKPTCMVLPYYGQDGRWFETGDDYPWYPTLRLFRRGPNDAWQDAIHRLAAHLEIVAAGRVAHRASEIESRV